MLLITIAVVQNAVTLNMRRSHQKIWSQPLNAVVILTLSAVTAVDQRGFHLPKSIQFWCGSHFTVIAGIFL